MAQPDGVGPMTLRAILGEASDVYPTLHDDSYSLIVSDGAYGIGGFPGDPRSVKALPEWYRPHLAEWDRLAAPSSSLYFWNSPEGCARMLVPIEAAGWTRNSRIVWHKGGGQTDPETIRCWPEHYSEECHVYVRESVDISALAASALAVADAITHRSLGEGVKIAFNKYGPTVQFRNIKPEQNFTRRHQSLIARRVKVFPRIMCRYRTGLPVNHHPAAKHGQNHPTGKSATRRHSYPIRGDLVRRHTPTEKVSPRLASEHGVMREQMVVECA